MRSILKFLKIYNNLEIHYDGDLPARSGMGSSSCFVVGLINTIKALKGININKDPRGREKPSDHTPIEITLA